MNSSFQNSPYPNLYTPQNVTPSSPSLAPISLSVDRLTDLQNQLDYLSSMFFIFIGVIQRDSPPVPIYHNENESQTIHFEEQDNHKLFREQTEDMAQKVAHSIKTINKIIESLPGESIEEKEYEILEKLQIQNVNIENQFREKLFIAETWLSEIEKALETITEDKFQEKD